MAALCAGCGNDRPAAQAPSAASSAAVPVTKPAAMPTDFTRPVVDGNTPFPPLSGAVLEALAAQVPELASRREALLAAESTALQGVLDSRRGKATPSKGKGKAAQHRPAGLISQVLDRLVPSALAGDFAMEQVMSYIVGHNFVLLLGTAGANEDTSRDGPGRRQETVEGGRVVASASTAIENGQPVATLETTVDLPLFFVDANTKVSLVGSVCPAPDGKVDFTLKLGANGHAGRGGATTYDQNVEVKVALQVNDEAEIADTRFDVKQDTRSTIGGRQAWVESNLSMPGGLSGAGGKPTVTRSSSQATDVEVQNANNAIRRAAYLADGAVMGAKGFWQKGGCVKIEARSPGKVKPGATSKIPVAVKHVKDGSSVAAKVKVELSGGKSVDPALIPKAPGEVIHVAPGDKKSAMKITLTATSRRGKDVAVLDLSAAGDAYYAEGGLQDFHGTGTICDIARTFTIQGGGNVVTFQPVSEKGGTYSYQGVMKGFGVFGKGTYVVDYNGGVPVGITGTGVGSVKTPMGVFSNPGVEKYTLTPRDGC
ncbi:MAG: hypothetical protein OEX21_10765 [Betaproteobacteria bacterium]|nr:hypothetical protein [Betaproteobacteria bacterium]